MEAAVYILKNYIIIIFTFALFKYLNIILYVHNYTVITLYY